MLKKSVSQSNIEHKEDSPENLSEQLTSLDFFLKKFFLYHSSIDVTKNNDVLIIKNLVKNYFGLLENLYKGMGIPPSTFLVEDKKSFEMLFFKKDGFELRLEEFLYRIIYTAKYLDPLHALIASGNIGASDIIPLESKIKGFINNFEAVNEKLLNDSGKNELEYELLNKKFSKNKKLLHGVIARFYDDDILADGAKLLEKKWILKKKLSISEEDYLIVLLNKWYSLVDFKTFEESLSDEGKLENDAKFLSKESLKNGSYLRLLARLLNAKYVYDDHLSGNSGGKPIVVRMGGKVFHFVRSTSKRGQEIIRNGGRKGTMKVLGKIAGMERKKLISYISPSNNIMTSSAKAHYTKAIDLAELIQSSCKKGNRKVTSRLLSLYSDKIIFLKTNYGFKFNTVIGIKGGKFRSKTYKMMLRKTVVLRQGIKSIEGKIGVLKKKLAVKLNRLNVLARFNPSESKEYRKQAVEINEKMNKKILSLQRKGVKFMSKLDDKTLHLMSKRKGFVRNYVKWNSKLGNAIQKIEGNKYMQKAGFTRRGLVGWGIMTLVTYSMFQNEGEEEVLKKFGIDILDAGVGFIPVLGGINDLIVFAKGEDWNGRDLSPKELGERLGFGVIGLIPGVGWLIKIGKGTKKAKNISRIARVANIYRKISNVAYKGANAYALGSLGLYGVIGIKDFSTGIVKGGLNWMKGDTELPPAVTTDEENFHIDSTLENTLTEISTVKLGLLRDNNLSVDEKIEKFVALITPIIDKSSLTDKNDISEIATIKEKYIKEIITHGVYSCTSISYSNGKYKNIIDTTLEEIEHDSESSSIRVLSPENNRSTIKKSKVREGMFFENMMEFTYGKVRKTLWPPYESTKFSQIPFFGGDKDVQTYIDGNYKYLQEQLFSGNGKNFDIGEINGLLIKDDSFYLNEIDGKSYFSLEFFDKGELFEMLIPITYLKTENGQIDLYDNANIKFYIQELLTDYIRAKQ